MPDRVMLLLVLLPVAVAAAVVGLRHGGLRAVLALRLRHPWLVLVAAAVQFVRLTDPAWAGPLLTPWRAAVPVVLGWALVTAFVLVNLSGLPTAGRWAAVAFLAGLSMNSLAVAVNGGMPFSAPAARWAGFSEERISAYVVGHPELTAESRLAPLADVIPVPGLPAVASVGDLLIFGGLTLFLISTMMRGVPDHADVASADV